MHEIYPTAKSGSKITSLIATYFIARWGRKFTKFIKEILIVA